MEWRGKICILSYIYLYFVSASENSSKQSHNRNCVTYSSGVLIMTTIIFGIYSDRIVRKLTRSKVHMGSERMFEIRVN